MNNVRKIELHNNEDIPCFCKRVIELGGMWYHYEGTNTIVVKGGYPIGFSMDISDWVTDYDVFMLNVAGK